MNRKLKFAFVLLCAVAVASVAYAALLANYVIPSSVLITAAPGITVYDEFGNAVTTLNWGDVQRGMDKTFTIKAANTQGTVVLYLTDASLTSDLPANVGTLTWDFSSKYGGGYAPYMMAVGGGFSAPGDALITLHFTALSDAPVGALNFAITISAFGSPTG